LKGDVARAPVRVVFLISGLEVGGAEAVLLKVLPRFSERVQAHVISMTTIGPVGKRLVESGIPVEALGMTKGLSGVSGVVRLVHRLRALKPDLVQTVMYHADLVGGLASRFARVPKLVWWIHNSGAALHALSPMTRLVLRACAQLSTTLPDLILCCAELARRNHISFGYERSKIEVIPNGFDLRQFSPDHHAFGSVRAELGIPPTAPIVGLVARLDPQKDHRSFFATASRVHRRLPQVHFLLVGAGLDSGNEQVRQWVDDEGIGAVTHLLGRRDDVPRIMSALTILASSSIAEAFPNVIGEAMACEVPCAVTDAGDSALMVGETGRVFRPSDPDAAAQAWIELLSLSDDQRKTLGHAARQRIAERFELSALIAKQERIYFDLTERAQ
jgi:glycosyltransferase involved in cell wall biosynthesis